MKEAQRERDTAEKRLHELAKRTTHHDEHLRVIDAWFCQVSEIMYTIVVVYGAHTLIT